MRTTSQDVLRGLLWGLVVLSLSVTVATALSCRPDGDVNEDTSLTPVDALRVCQHFLQIADPPLTPCQQVCANLKDPATSGITPADALCILQRFLGLESCLDHNQDSIKLFGRHVIPYFK